MYKVQEVAKIAGVSVRTLHHYDSIGLMKPSNIGTNRYRYYNEEDLKLLQHILFFKEIGFSLKKIQEIVAGGFDPDYALTQHIELLNQKKVRIEKLIENAELTKREAQGTQALTNEERFSAFSIKKVDDNIKKYQRAPAVEDDVETNAETAEAAEAVADRMPSGEPAVDVKTVGAVEDGDTAPVETAETVELEAVEAVPVESTEEPKPEKEEEDLEEINREGNRIYNTVAILMHLPPGAPEVQKEMQAYYTLLNRFYDCTPKMFRGLGDLYASDSRFASNIDQHGDGLSSYLKEAMYIFAEELQYA